MGRGHCRPAARQRRFQVRAPEHHQRYEVVDVEEPVALPYRHLDLVVGYLDAGVGDAQLHGPQDSLSLAPHLARELHELGYAASASPRQPPVQLRRGFPRRRAEHGAQSLLEQVSTPQRRPRDPQPVERRGLALGEGLGVQIHPPPDASY